MPMSEEQLEAFGRRVEAKVALHGTDFWAWWARNPHLHSQASSRSQTPTGLLTPSHDGHGMAQPTRLEDPGSRGFNLAWLSSWPHMLTPDRETPEVYEEPGEQIATPNLDDGVESEDCGPTDDTPDRILRSQAFRYRYFLSCAGTGGGLSLYPSLAVRMICVPLMNILAVKEKAKYERVSNIHQNSCGRLICG